MAKVRPVKSSNKASAGSSNVAKLKREIEGKVGLGEGERERQPVTVYLNRDLFDEFRRKIAPVTASRMIEAMIRDYMS